MTNLTRKYIEMAYTFDQETAAITRGLAESDKPFDHPVHLFLSDTGLVASVTVEATSLSLAGALDMAEDLAYDEIDRYLPTDSEDIPDPWDVRIIDHDGMAESLRRSYIPAPVARPEKPVDDDDEDPGSQVLVHAGPTPTMPSQEA